VATASDASRRGLRFGATGAVLAVVVQSVPGVAGDLALRPLSRVGFTLLVTSIGLLLARVRTRDLEEHAHRTQMSRYDDALASWPVPSLEQASPDDLGVAPSRTDGESRIPPATSRATSTQPWTTRCHRAGSSS
jgi:hypothetical protein